MAVAAIFCIVILIACLVYLRIKGEKIAKVEKLNSDKGGRNSVGGSPPKNTAQVAPSSKPNFGGDEDDVEFVGSQDPSNLFKSKEDQQ